MGLLDALRRRREEERAGSAPAGAAGPGGDGAGGGAPANLPDPSKPAQNRGRWEDAALTNVEITELVKRQIHTVTRPWEK